MIPLTLWARAFAWTVLVEEAVATPLLAPSGATVARRLALVFYANLASHPVLWLVLPDLGLRPGASTFLGELWAFSSELLFYRLTLPSLPWSRAVAASGLANGLSLGLGLWARKLIGWP